jgi:CubicO group peptidase (beta-lactamase class C family)
MREFSERTVSYFPNGSYRTAAARRVRSFNEEGLTPMVDVHGTCDARFGPVRDTPAAQLDSGNETGASIAVDVEGRTVVDIWGGWCDPGRARPWTENTITSVASLDPQWPLR